MRMPDLGQPVVEFVSHFRKPVSRFRASNQKAAPMEKAAAAPTQRRLQPPCPNTRPPQAWSQALSSIAHHESQSLSSSHSQPNGRPASISFKVSSSTQASTSGSSTTPSTVRQILVDSRGTAATAVSCKDAFSHSSSAAAIAFKLNMKLAVQCHSGGLSRSAEPHTGLKVALPRPRRRSGRALVRALAI
jgi:hypothetical protein